MDKKDGITLVYCEQCSEQLIDCDAIVFANRWYFHEDCFDEWIDDGKEFTLFDENGEEQND